MVPTDTSSSAASSWSIRQLARSNLTEHDDDVVADVRHLVAGDVERVVLELEEVVIVSPLEARSQLLLELCAVLAGQGPLGLADLRRGAGDQPDVRTSRFGASPRTRQTSTNAFSVSACHSPSTTSSSRAPSRRRWELRSRWTAAM